jgi:hypothetical protein
MRSSQIEGTIDGYPIADDFVVGSLLDGDSTYQGYHHEFFDALTAYANIILPGVAKTDLIAFWGKPEELRQVGLGN